MVFFNVLPKPKPTVYRGKDKAYRNAINNIKRCQHEAWIHVINKGCKEGECQLLDTYNTRICLHHFYPSVINEEENGKYVLKTGAAPTMYLTKFSMENDNYKENKNLQRIVGTPEDLQCVYDFNSKHSSNESCKKSSSISLNATIVTPTRESRTNKHRYEKVQLENKENAKKLNNDTICNIQDLHANFPKISPQ